MKIKEFIEKWNVGYEDKEQKNEFAAEMRKDLDSIVDAALRKHEVIKSVCKHEWHRTGDPDRQSCRCTKCGEYDS
jgi:hypothetical protein